MTPKSGINKIIIFRALQLGDMLCSIPAFRALRAAYPAAEITLAGLPWAATLVERFPNYFDRFEWFPGFPGLPEQPFSAETFSEFLLKVQKEKYDLALQMQGNGSVVNPMVELFGARFSAGFKTEGHYFQDNGLFLSYPENCSEPERHVRLMEHIGVASNGLELEFPLFDKDFRDFEDLRLPIKPGRYVCIHPGSRGAWRQWPTGYFAALADYCSKNGFTPVLTGTSDELEIVADVISRMEHTPVVAAGKTSIGAVAVLIKNAYALISNCTGVSHMASAFKTPSVVISMDGEPHRWAPLDRETHRVIDWTKTPLFEKVFEETRFLIEEWSGKAAARTAVA